MFGTRKPALDFLTYFGPFLLPECLRISLHPLLQKFKQVRLVTDCVGWVPIEDHRRGGHLAITHPEASRISRALIEAGVIPDHRPPDIIRLAPVALYTSFEDCREAVARLKAIMDRRSFETFPEAGGRIT